MKGIALFLLAFLFVAALLVASQLDEMPDYQAYTKPRWELPR